MVEKRSSSDGGAVIRVGKKKKKEKGKSATIFGGRTAFLCSPALFIFYSPLPFFCAAERSTFSSAIARIDDSPVRDV